MSAGLGGIDFASVRDRQSQLLAIVLAVAALAYLAWKISESPEQALQFAFNGLSVGAVYALLAMGFTLVYSTVWFFDLYYGAAAAIGAYGVFYLRSGEALGGLYEVNEPLVNVAFAAVVAGVVAWSLREGLYARLRRRHGTRRLILAASLVSAGAGTYAGLVLTRPDEINVLLSPAIGVAVAAVAYLLLRRILRGAVPPGPRLAVAAIAGVLLGGYCALLIADAPGSRLYLSWAVSCLLAGAVGLALYRGLYVYMIARARSPLIMLVASLGVLLAMTAATTIVFEAAPRPLPDAFGSDPVVIAGATIKGFNVFTIGVALGGFAGLWLLLKQTSFGKAVRAIGDDEEVAKVVGINTTVVIAVVFFIGGVYAALAGLLSGHDTAIQPRMGLLLLLKGWIASVVGGLGNLYGAIVGGFALGMVEQFGIWDLAGEWRDVVSFGVLILFLSFWPKGLIPRK
ncbi:MAG: branched-chain amino acid ABC transporter permease [Chloroflexi bacterium]|nr:branched-chain amino acid ABC transporter permease [Chloroflexota bacterium]